MTQTAGKIRCAIYTRKSSEEGLALEFNSLDAQRESAEAYIASMKHEGWVCLPERYDDGGFTGGNMERPALKRLIADIDAGKIDCVVVYKVDRLSRSLLDFARMMETFETHGVSFVSVTQQFNTTHSMGRLTLNILLSFAQFEREIISERTRDKIAAARRKGKWAGGRPVLGYDLVPGPGGSKLVVNPDEAERVRCIFETYLELRSVRALARRLDELGWTTKAWTTKSGRAMGGLRLNSTTLFKLLTNVVYIGRVRHNEHVYEGEHEGIVDGDLFRRVQAHLRLNGTTGGGHTRNKHGALLKRMVRCATCGCAMPHHFASKNGKRYRYYVCANAQRHGYAWCKGDAPSLPAHELEQFVVERVREHLQSDAMQGEAVRRAQEQIRLSIAADQKRGRRVERQARALDDELRALEALPTRSKAQAERAGEVRRAVERLRAEACDLDDRIARADQRLIDEDELFGAVEAFEPVWEALTIGERERLIRALVERVEWDAASESVTVVFHEAVDGPREEAACPAV